MENFDDKYKKKNPFTVPEGYFDELTGRITGRIEKQKEVKKSSSLRGLKPYMGLVAIFFLALMVVQILFPGAKNTDLPDIEGENAIVQEMEAEDIFDSQFNPTNEEIIEKIRTTLAEEFEVDIDVIQPDAPLMETLELDSLDLVDMVVLVEKNFGFNVTGQDFAGIKTFQDFYDLVITRMQEAK